MGVQRLAVDEFEWPGMDPQPRFIEPTFGAAIDERLQPHMGERAQYVGENLDGAHPPDITGSALREAGVMRRASLIKLGVAIAALALAGWLTTVVVTSFAAKPTTTEDLTTVWNQAGPTRLGTPTRVTVPAGSTVVAFLVGADLTGIAGTTTGTCTAEPPTIRLGWPVQINRSLTGVLRDGQQTVAIAGWTNHTGAAVDVTLRCDSTDSTVEHFVAVPTQTAVVQTDRWFHPWVWLALGAVGALLIAVGASK